MENIAVIHVIMCRNFKQNCLLLWVHLNGLVELFPLTRWFARCNPWPRTCKENILWVSESFTCTGRSWTALKFTHNLHNFSRAKVSRLPVFESGFCCFRLQSGMRWRMTENSTEQLKETSIRSVWKHYRMLQGVARQVWISRFTMIQPTETRWPRVQQIYCEP